MKTRMSEAEKTIHRWEKIKREFSDLYRVYTGMMLVGVISIFAWEFSALSIGLATVFSVGLCWFFFHLKLEFEYRKYDKFMKNVKHQQKNHVAKKR